mgnify:CR=1 FL=1
MRSTCAAAACHPVPSGEGARVLLRDGEYGVAAGQACVFYADAGPEARVLGGGWIERALSRADAAGDGEPQLARTARLSSA